MRGATDNLCLTYLVDNGLKQNCFVQLSTNISLLIS